MGFSLALLYRAQRLLQNCLPKAGNAGFQGLMAGTIQKTGNPVTKDGSASQGWDWSKRTKLPASAAPHLKSQLVAVGTEQTHRVEVLSWGLAHLGLLGAACPRLHTWLF